MIHRAATTCASGMRRRPIRDMEAARQPRLDQRSHSSFGLSVRLLVGPVAGEEAGEAGTPGMLAAGSYSVWRLRRLRRSGHYAPGRVASRDL